MLWKSNNVYEELFYLLVKLHIILEAQDITF